MTSSDAQALPSAADREAVDALLSVLSLNGTQARTTEDIFTGISHPMPSGRIYGGQVLAQSLIAATRTLADDRAVHSMHGYFLRPGDASHGLTIAVDRIHDGRSFSTRRSQAYQNGVPIFSMIASAQDEDPGVEHAADGPLDVPAPETLASALDLADQLHPLMRSLVTASPIEVRHVTPPLYVHADPHRAAQQSVWMRARAPLPDNPLLHQAALAYLSDMTIQEPILRAHGVSWATPGLKVASLDHAMWWHRPARVDDWLLYVQESPNARGGRGLSTGRIFNRAGELVASVAQEAMVRVPTTH